MKILSKHYILLLLGIIIYIPNIIPVKFCVDMDLLRNKDNCILVMPQKVTGFDWKIIGDGSGFYKGNKDIKLTGVIPGNNFGQGINDGNNTFVCYGEYIGEDNFDGEQYKIFKVDKWDILKPIKRNSLQDFIPTPKSYLNLYDFIF